MTGIFGIFAMLAEIFVGIEGGSTLLGMGFKRKPPAVTGAVDAGTEEVSALQ